jgi:uncharacterized protein
MTNAAAAAHPPRDTTQEAGPGLHPRAPGGPTLLTRRCQDARRTMPSVQRCTITRRKRMDRKDAITWFEIPATDPARARQFYETVLATELRSEQMGPHQLAVFPYSAPGVGGCVMANDGARPSCDGNLVYLQAGASLQAALGRVQRAGGRIALDATALPDGLGVFAHIIDSEGNRVGLHAPA